MEDTIEPSPLSAPAVKVSVLMPVYNTKEEYLREAIESILSQTYRDFEFLIINDASTDPNVERVVKSYDDPRIRYYANTENTGISAVRNKLIDLSRGEYLAVMDHDDISLPERFAKEAAYLDAHPEVGVIGCQYEQFQDESHRSEYPLDDEDIRTAMMTACVLLHPTCMIRKSVLTATGLKYEERYSPAEDYALYCRLLEFTKFHNLDKVLFRYRWHSQNTSKHQHKKMVAAKAAVQKMVQLKHPDLIEKLQRIGRKVTRVKLFGFLPVLKNIQEKNSRRCLLFNHIPILKVIGQGESNWYYLFNIIPIYTIKREVYFSFSTDKNMIE